MDISTFGGAYPELPEKVPPAHKERRELLEVPRKWTQFFNEALSSYLAGEPAFDSTTYYEKLKDYNSWSSYYLDNVSQRLQSLHNPAAHLSAHHELNFHHINSTGPILWTRLDETLAQSHQMNSDDYTQVQLHLAGKIAPTVHKFKQKILRHGNDLDEALTDELGFLSEVDAHVVNLEIMKQHPEVVILPAPSQFEQNPRAKSSTGQSLNSDFVAINTQTQSAIGLQVKTSLASGRVGQKYDRDFVTLIDAHVDMGNTIAVKSTLRTLPGQIALSLLAERPLSDPLSIFPKSEFLKRRAMAKEVMRGRRSFLNQATHHIGERVLYNLQRQPADFS